MTNQELCARLGTLPLYAGLDDSERSEMAVGMRLLNFPAGDALMRQGEKPDGIYFILSGRVQVTTRLPGGGETLVAEREPGSMLGELALIRWGERTATVTAIEAVEAVYADWRFLSAALAQHRPAAFKVFRQLAVVLAGRLRLLYERIHAVAMQDDHPYEMQRLPPVPHPAFGQPPDGFDVGAILPILPCFRDLEADSVRTLRKAALLTCPRRGHHLLPRDQPAGHAYAVVRGAVASGFVDNGGMHLVSVRGPGSLCGVTPLIEDKPVSLSLVVCENAILLNFPRQRFLELLLGDDRMARDLLIAVTAHQAAMVSRATNHLKRLVGLSRLFRQLSGSAA